MTCRQPCKADSILDLYRSGATYREIEAQTGAAKATIAKHVRRAGLSRRAPNSPSSRPEVLCKWCGALCRSANRQCRDCTRFGTAFGGENPVALTGGRWVPTRGILVWRADQETAA